MKSDPIMDPPPGNFEHHFAKDFVQAGEEELLPGVLQDEDFLGKPPGGLGLTNA